MEKNRRRREYNIKRDIKIGWEGTDRIQFKWLWMGEMVGSFKNGEERKIVSYKIQGNT